MRVTVSYDAEVGTCGRLATPGIDFPGWALQGRRYGEVLGGKEEPIEDG